MDKNPSMRSFRRTSLPLVLPTVVALGGLYIHILADFLAQAPSAA
jgi:hypothetical protein